MGEPLVPLPLPHGQRARSNGKQPFGHAFREREAIFQGLSTRCPALSDFSTLLGHLGSFRGHLGTWGRNLLSRKPARSCSSVLWRPNERSKMAKNSKSDPVVLCTVHLRPFWGGRILTDFGVPIGGLEGGSNPLHGLNRVKLPYIGVF